MRNRDPMTTRKGGEDARRVHLSAEPTFPLGILLQSIELLDRRDVRR